ncbi:MAG: addiction module protein [Cyanobium sp.]
MSVDDKLQAMELLWADLCRNPEQVASPAWHDEVLRQRGSQRLLVLIRWSGCGRCCLPRSLAWIWCCWPSACPGRKSGSTACRGRIAGCG